MLWKTWWHSFDSLIRSIKAVFHQFVGLFFLLLGLSAAVASLKEYKQLGPGESAPAWRFYLTVGFAALWLLFAVSSFRRARGVKKKEP